MSQGIDWKGKLQTFCKHYSCSTPKYSTTQSIDWEGQCTVTFSNKFLNNGEDSQQTLSTRANKAKKKESEGAAAELMLQKLNRLLSPHVQMSIRHAIHLKKVSKSMFYSELSVLESLFSDENVQNSLIMQDLIQCNDGQWISVHKIANMPMLCHSFGEYGWTDEQSQEIIDLFVGMVQNHSQILQISKDRQFIRRKELFDIWQRNESQSEKLRFEGMELLAQHKYRRAILKYLEAMKYNKSDYRISMHLSSTYLRIKDCENALKFANKAIMQQPSFSKPYVRAAKVLCEMDQFQKAIATMEHALLNKYIEFD